MATYIMFGKMTQGARQSVSAKRTLDAIALIKQHGGEYKAGYALLGDVDFMVIVELPDTERAMQVSMALSRLLHISFRSAPAITIDAFDALASV